MLCQRNEEVTLLEKIPLLSAKEKLTLVKNGIWDETNDLSQSHIELLCHQLYERGTLVINANVELLTQYQRLPHHQELSSTGEIADEDALRAIFIFKVALDNLTPMDIYRFYLDAKRALPISASFRLPNNSKFCSNKALELILQIYIIYHFDQYNFLPELTRKQISNLSTSGIKAHIMKKPQKGCHLIMRGRILELLQSLSKDLDGRKGTQTLDNKNEDDEKEKEKEKEMEKESPEPITTGRIAQQAPGQISLIDFLQELTVEKFIDIAKTHSMSAEVLAQLARVRKIIAEKLTIEQFIELINIDETVALRLASDPGISKLVYEPGSIIAIMKTNSLVGKMIITTNRLLQEIICAQDLPDTMPELFGYMRFTKEKELAQQCLITTVAGLQDSETYCDQVLFALGYVFLNEVTLFPQGNFTSKTGQLLCIEFGKLQLDHLHGKPVALSAEVAKLATMLTDLNQMKRSPRRPMLFEKNFEEFIKGYQKRLGDSLQAYFFTPLNPGSEAQKSIKIAIYIYKVCEVLSPGKYTEKLHSLNEVVFSKNSLKEAISNLNEENQIWRLSMRL